MGLSVNSSASKSPLTQDAPSERIYPIQVNMRTSPLDRMQKQLSSAFSKTEAAARAISRFAVRCITLPFVLLTSATIMAAQIAILSIAALPMLILLSPFLLMLSMAAAITGIAFAAIFIPPLLICSALIS